MPGEDEILVVSPSAAAGAVLLLLGLAAARACAMGNGEGGTLWDCDLRVENDRSFLSVTDHGGEPGDTGPRDRRFWRGRDRANWGREAGRRGTRRSRRLPGRHRTGVIRSHAGRG